MGTKGSDSDKSSTKGSDSSGTRVEVTLPMNQGIGLTPPVFIPPAASPFIQPAATSSGLFEVITPMGFPAMTPAPTSSPNIIVTVPPREGKGTSSAGMNNHRVSGESSEEEGESDQGEEQGG